MFSHCQKFQWIELTEGTPVYSLDVKRHENKHRLFRTCVVAIGHSTSGGGFIDIIAGRLHGGLIDTSSAQAVRETLGACQPSNNPWIMINHRSMTRFGTQNRYVIVP